MATNSKINQRKWHVLQIRSGRYEALDVALKRMECEIFVPRVNVIQSTGNVNSTPLFPGYAFVMVEAGERFWSEILKIPGVYSWLRFDGVAATVPSEVIDSVKRKVSELNLRGGTWNRLRAGEFVTVVTDKIDTIGQVVEDARSPNNMVVVMLEFMGRLIRASVPWDSVDRSYGGNPLPVQYRKRLRRTRGKGRYINRSLVSV